MESKWVNILVILSIIVILVLGGYIVYKQKILTSENNKTITETEETTSDESSYIVQKPIDPIIQKVEPFISKIVFDDVNLRSKAGSIVSGCPSGDKECQLNKVYRYVVESYNYYSDPRNREFIQSPYETMNIKGGDCEDLTILLNSLLVRGAARTLAWLSGAKPAVNCL